MLPRRWVVERTIAWLNRCRRLAKDWENLNRKALAFLRLASIRLMLQNFVILLDVPGQTLSQRSKRSVKRGASDGSSAPRAGQRQSTSASVSNRSRQIASGPRGASPIASGVAEPRRAT